MIRQQKASDWKKKIGIFVIGISCFIFGAEGTALASSTEVEKSTTHETEEHAAHGESEPIETFESHLTGSWGGLRSTALEKGISIGIANTGDLLANSRGADSQVRYANLLETSLTADLDRLLGWPGGTVYIMALDSLGTDPGEATGTITAPSNLATGNDTFWLFEAWFEQALFNNRIGILAGLYAADSEFDAKSTAAVFLNGAFGTGLDLSETGINGPSIFPATSLGVRVRANVSDEIALRVAVLDGVPGNPDNPRGTHIALNKGDGLLILSEINYEPAEFNFLRFGLGSFVYTTEFDDLVDTQPNGDPVRRNGTYGVYGFAEGNIFKEADTLNQGLSGFIRIGGADEDVNQFANFYGAGLVYTGLIPNRDVDVLGLGVTVGVNGRRYEQALESAGESTEDAEIALELTYWAEVTPWLSFQPVLQYYINPSTDPALDDSIAGGFRYNVNF